MTQQIINTGAVANDGTGESLRDAFTAVNNNFANVWAAGPVDTNVVIRNNEVTTNVTNLDLKIAGNGVGNVVVASTLQPTITGVYDLGRTSNQWGEVHAQYYYGNGAFLTGVTANAITVIDANGTLLTGNANSEITFTPGNNFSIVGNASASTITFSVSNTPTFANLFVTNTGTVGNVSIANTTISTTVANANITLAPVGTGKIVATANIYAPNFYGNVIGNISGNLAAPGVDKGVVFNDAGTANAVSGLTFNKTTNALTSLGNVYAAEFVGDGYGLNFTMVDRGGDSTNWDAMTQMGTYTVNRLNWGGVTGAPLDSGIYVGLLEVKVANTQGSVQSVSQSFYPGAIDDYSDVKTQYNRSLWSGSWTPWIKVTNDDQYIDGGTF